jgi:CSLREA domain-containing protein
MFFQHVIHSATLCRFHRWSTVLLTLLLLIVLSAPKVQAASLTVNSLADTNNGSDGVCTLREAITAANNNANHNECVSTAYGNDTITFGVAGTITLGSSLPNIADAAGLTIEGGNTVTISGNNAVRVFQVDGGAALTLRNLTVTQGQSAGNLGGGLFNLGGAVTISNSTFSSNSANFGGGIFTSGGTVIVVNSTFSGNSAASSGGGISTSGGTVIIGNSTFSGNSTSFGGGIFSDGTVIIGSSTFSGNSATNSGGGIANTGGTATIVNSTFFDNRATSFGGGASNVNSGAMTISLSTFSDNSASNLGGGIYNFGATVTLTNSIVANSPAGGNCNGTITNGGHNLDSGASCGWGSANGSLSNINPQLGPLANNGGPTQTHALTGSSPAINAGNNSLIPPDLADQDGDGNTGEPLPFDQRGLSFPRIVHDIVDIGAFEVVVQVYVPIVLK